MDFDIPSPSQFPSPSQWVRACTRPASADMSVDMNGGVVRWMASQSADPAVGKLIAESAREEKRERKPHSNASGTSSWAASTSTSSTTRTASLPTFYASSSGTLPCHASGPTTSSGRKIPPRSKPMSKKIPPSRAYSMTSRTQDDVPLDPEIVAELFVSIRDTTAKMDEYALLKQVIKAKEEKKAASSTSGDNDNSRRRNTVSASSSGPRFRSTASTARPPRKTASTSTTSASAPSLSTAIRPTIKLSRDIGADTDVEMMIDSDRDTDLECSAFTNSLGGFAITDTRNESFSMHVDDIVPLPAKRTLGRMHSAGTVSSRSAIASSNSAVASSSKALANTSSSTFTASFENRPQSTQVRPPVAPSASQRRPPLLGMRRPPNLSNAGFLSSQSRYANTQSPYVASQAKAQKQVTLPPFKPPLLSKPNPKPIYTLKQTAENPESPPTSTPELERDEGDGDGEHEDGAAGADSSFDVSFGVDADALEATMRQYD